jgi:hypothetical protein
MSSKSKVQGSELLGAGISRDEARLRVERRMYKTAAIERQTDDEYYVLNGETGRDELPRKGRPNEPYTVIHRGKWDNEDIQAEQKRALARWTKLVAQRREANYWLIDNGFIGEVIDKVELERHLDQCFPIKLKSPNGGDLAGACARYFVVPKEEPRARKAAVAWKALWAVYPGGVPLNAKYQEINEKVTEWIRDTYSRTPALIDYVDSVDIKTVKSLLTRPSA